MATYNNIKKIKIGDNVFNLAIPTKTSELTNNSGFVTTDEKVKQENTTSTDIYRVLLSGDSNDTTSTSISHKSTNLKFTPSTGNLQTTQINGVTIGSSPKFTDSEVSTLTLASGSTTGTSLSFGGKYTLTAGSKTVSFTMPSSPTVPTITLNGSTTTSPGFYAPTSAGTNGQYLKSNSSGAPTWVDLPTVSSTAAGLVPMSGTSNQPKILCATKNGYVHWESFEVWDSTSQDKIGSCTEDEEGIYLVIQEATATKPGLMSVADKIAFNAIPTTYLPLSGGTITGGINIQNSQGVNQARFLGDPTYSYLELNAAATGSKVLRLVSNTNGNIGLYDPGASAWIIRNDTNGNTYVGNDSITIGNHSSPIGTVLTSHLTAAKSVNASTAVSLCSINLPKGTWVIIGQVRFPANNTGARRANITTDNGGNDIHIQSYNAQGALTQCQVSCIAEVTASSATYYLNVYHTATTALTMPAGTSEGYINGLRAVRIA